MAGADLTRIRAALETVAATWPATTQVGASWTMEAVDVTGHNGVNNLELFVALTVAGTYDISSPLISDDAGALVDHFAISTTAAPNVFTPVTLPHAIQAGAYLKAAITVTAANYVALGIKRTA